jgi:hypothetical protein
MPGSRPRNGAQDNAGLDGANITRFLWDDEEGGGSSHYNASEMGFPTLTRTEDQIVSCIPFTSLIANTHMLLAQFI